MSFKQMMANDLPGMYQSLGDSVIYANDMESKEIYIMENESYEIQSLDFMKYRAIHSDVSTIALGDTLEVDGAVQVVHNFSPSDDGLEMYIGVK